MSRFIPIAIACLSAWAPAAYAFDWSARTTLSETVEIHDNRLLRPQPLGPSYNSISNLMFDAHALSPTSKFDFLGGITYRAYSGPGEAGTQDALDNNVAARFERSPTKVDTYNITASRRETQSSTIQLEETGVATLNGSTITTTYGGGFRHDFNSRNSLASQTTLTKTDFTLNNGTPLTSLTSVLTWNHRATPTTIFSPSLQFQHLQFDNATQSEVTFWRAAVGMRKELTPQLDFSAEAGGTFLDSQQGSPIVSSSAASDPAAFGTVTALPSGTATDWIGNVALTYRLNKSTTVSAAASKSVGPTTFGQFLTTQTVSGSLSYIINNVSSVSFTGAYTQQSSVAAASSASSANTITAVASYSRLLARDWRSIVSYRYIHREGGTDTANSNAVIFTVSRDVTILP